MYVYVIADTDVEDLLFRVAVPGRGISRLHRLPKQADRLGGNPYLLYRRAVAEFAPDLGDFSVIVATVSSGELARTAEAPA